MDRDRKKICKIISDMLDSQDKLGIYHTSTCYTRLEHYIESVRVEALGWCHAYVCLSLDGGEDPRVLDVPLLLERAMDDLAD